MNVIAHEESSHREDVAMKGTIYCDIDTNHIRAIQLIGPNIELFDHIFNSRDKSHFIRDQFRLGDSSGSI